MCYNVNTQTNKQSQNQETHRDISIITQQFIDELLLSWQSHRYGWHIRVHQSVEAQGVVSPWRLAWGCLCWYICFILWSQGWLAKWDEITGNFLRFWYHGKARRDATTQGDWIKGTQHFSASASSHATPVILKKKIKVYKKSETSSFWQNFYIVYNKALFHPNGTKENLALTSVGVILQTRVRQLYTK